VKKQLNDIGHVDIDDSEKQYNIFKVKVDCTEGKCASSGLAGGSIAAIVSSVLGICAAIFLAVTFFFRDKVRSMYQSVVQQST